MVQTDQTHGGATRVASGATRRARHSRPIQIVGDVAVVTLTKGQVAIIDAADVPLVEGRNWYALECACGFYAAREHDGRIQQMHRLIMDAPPGLFVDHANRATLDNRRANLRICTRAENAANRIGWPRNKAGFKGVWAKGQRFMATIQRGAVRTHLGPFDTAEEASAAYADAAADLFGEFARSGPTG